MNLTENSAIRPFVVDDTAACKEIYSANLQRALIPKHYAAEFEAQLTDPSFLTLVFTIQGRVVACGSVNYLERRSAAWLSFGLVHPDFQRQGIGSTMVLTRMSLLEPAEELPCTVYLSATPHSRGFFVKHGFGWRSSDGDGCGNEFETLYFPLRRAIILSIRHSLKRSGIQYSSSLEVPCR